MIICLGPVCVPLHLLLPFLVALAHQHGYLTWFKREWVTFNWWRQQCNRLFGKQAAPAPQREPSSAIQADCCSKQASGGGSSMGNASAAGEGAAPGKRSSAAATAGGAGGSGGSGKAD